MFEHLDDPNPPQGGPEARAAVDELVASRRRRRQIRRITAISVVVIVGLAIGLPLGLRSGNGGTTRPAGQPTSPPSSASMTASTMASSPRQFESVVDVGFPGNVGLMLGRTRAGTLELADTADGGKTWRPARSPVDLTTPLPSRGAGPPRFFVLTSTEHVYVTYEGKTFTPMPGTEGGFVDSSGGPTNPVSVWALRSSCPAGSPSCRPVLSVSNDFGLTFHAVDAQPVMGNRDGQIAHPSHEVTWVVSLDSSGSRREPVVSRTSDGATSWTSTAGNTSVPECLDLHIVGASSDWLQLLCNRADGSGWKLLTTSDSGRTWALTSGPRGPVANGLSKASEPPPMYHCDDPARCLIVLPGPGGAPYVWHTTDGGKTWGSAPLP